MIIAENENEEELSNLEVDDIDLDLDLNDFKDTDIITVDDDLELDLDMDLELELDISNDEPENVEYTRDAKLVGKHSLRHDKIFVGGKARKNYDDDATPEEEEPEEEQDDSTQKMSFEIEYDSPILGTYLDNDERLLLKKLKERVLDAVLNKTNININLPRRKPSNVDFIKYYRIVKKELENDIFSDAEIFVELSIYFSDNLFGMFRLLDSISASKILSDLEKKYNLSELKEMVFK